MNMLIDSPSEIYAKKILRFVEFPVVPNPLNSRYLQRLPEIFRGMSAFVAMGIMNWNLKYVSKERHVATVHRNPAS